MSRTTLTRTRVVIDCNYLCHRAWYAFGSIKGANLRNGVIYGFLKDIIDLQDRFHPECFIFCFDRGKLYREVEFPAYKAKRKEKYKNDPAEAEFKVERDKQTKALRKIHLPALGYKNIFSQWGYEADDCIASVIQNGERRNIRYVVVSADHDLYQLLGDRTSIYKPASHQLYTLELFRREFGVEPEQWADVKSIAGCDGDDIPGIKGIGEKTAADFISGRLTSGKRFETIVKNNKTWRKNLHLVRLPYPGTKQFKVHAPEEMKRGSWRHLAAKLNMHSIKDKEPGKKGGFGIA